MSEEELAIMNLLTEALNRFVVLDEDFPGDREDFRRHIRRLHDKIRSRVGVRATQFTRCTLEVEQ